MKANLVNRKPQKPQRKIVPNRKAPANKASPVNRASLINRGAAKPVKQEKKAVAKKTSPSNKHVEIKKAVGQKVPSRTKKTIFTKPATSMLEAYKKGKVRQQADPAPATDPVPAPATPAATTTDIVVATADEIPTAGAEQAISDHDAFKKGFAINFKIKFNSFARNEQQFLKTSNDNVVVQALGPHYAPHDGKIAAYVTTEGGWDPDEHGVPGTVPDGLVNPDGNTVLKGWLLSQKLDAEKWYNVKFELTGTKNNQNVWKPGTQVKLTVGDKTDGSGDQTETGTIQTLNNADPTDQAKNLFLAESPAATKVLAGSEAGSGDIGLNGTMADLTVSEVGDAEPTVAASR